MKIFLKVLTWTGLAVVWGIILLVLFYKIGSPFVFHTGFIYFAITIILFALAIIFRKKIKGGALVALIYATILAVALNSVAYMGMIGYLSDYSKDKWEKYTEHRHFMITDLCNEYELIGLNENQIKDLLGEPTKVVDRIDGYYAYEYYAGHRYWIDPYVLEIVFKDGISTYVTEGEH